MKKFLAHSIAGAVALGIGAWAAPSEAASTLKVTGCFVKNHDFMVAFFKTFHDPLNAENGAVKMNYIGGPEVTPTAKQAPALQRGLVDVIVCPGAYYGGLLATARLAGPHNKSLAEIRKNGAWEIMQDSWGKGLNARLLAWTHFSAQKFYIYTKFKPKLSEKTGIDLTGIKMRSTGMYNSLLKGMGATTVVMAPDDVYAGLERGVVGGLAWPWGSVAVYGWERFLKYRISPSFFSASLLTMINKDKWNALSKAEKDLLEKYARNYEEKSDAIVEERGKADDAKQEKAGMETIELKGEHAKAYLRTIYEAKWAENDALKYNIDYKKLKSLLYTPF